jgi:D-serine deaminase-like pyridoxal phosphate-dependent protein
MTMLRSDPILHRELGQLPNEPVETPCFVISEAGVLHNLTRTAEASGGIERLMPHVKTHRAAWVVALMAAHGVTAFKCATPTEVEMCLEAGARAVTWAFPTVNPAGIRRFVASARKFPEARLTGMLDSERGLEIWRAELDGAPDNIDLRIDLDPGMGRTGIAIGAAAEKLARQVARLGRFAGWHVYDGHIKGDTEERRAQVHANAVKVAALRDALARDGMPNDIIAGGSYTFSLWPDWAASRVSPGSFTFSSDQHDVELPELGWQPAAFVLATVISTHAGTATLDAGCKAISPDKPLAERFRWDGRIKLMNEEHTIVEADKLAVGDQVLLMPRHACTTAYLFDEALVKTVDGAWERRPQLGGVR